MKPIDALRPWKLYHEGDVPSACFTLSLWGVLILIAMIAYFAVTGDRNIEPAFYALGLLTPVPAALAFLTLKRKNP